VQTDTLIMDIKKLTFDEFCYKLSGKIHHYRYVKNKASVSPQDFFMRYKSYRHALKCADKINGSFLHTNYLAAVPNPGAGIGHQMANWMAGYYYAKYFGLKFAHIPFSNEHHPLSPNKWDTFLGFGEGEKSFNTVKKEGYKVVRLPQFDFGDEWQVSMIKKIINSYSQSKVVFLCEQDQFLRDLYLVSADLQNKFRNASSRKFDRLQYDNQHFNIAVHVRRTVVIDGKKIEENEKVRAMRWLSNDYYEKVLKSVLQAIKPSKPIAIWLFSTGKADEFAEFAKYGDVHFCNDMDEYMSFAHLIYADLLITSKSSFSYKPALMNDGIKVCPRNFWHSYPDAKDWILCENDGSFDVDKLKNLFK
jgi:hypothetical protein